MAPRKSRIGEAIRLGLIIGIFGILMFFGPPLLGEQAKIQNTMSDVALRDNTELRFTELGPWPLLEMDDGSFFTQEGDDESPVYSYRFLRGDAVEEKTTASMSNPQVEIKTAATDQEPQVFVTACSSTPKSLEERYVDRPAEAWGVNRAQEPMCSDRIVLVVPDAD